MKVKTKEARPTHTIDSLTKKIRDISANKKVELENDPDATKAVCDLADRTGDMFYSIMQQSMQGLDEMEKKKVMLLTLHLAYLKVSSDIIGSDDEFDLISGVPTSAELNFEPIDNKTTPMYL